MVAFFGVRSFIVAAMLHNERPDPEVHYFKAEGFLGRKNSTACQFIKKMLEEFVYK